MLCRSHGTYGLGNKDSTPRALYFGKASFVSQWDKQTLPSLSMWAAFAEPVLPEPLGVLPGTDLVEWPSIGEDN